MKGGLTRKGNIKKLVLRMIVTIIAPFILADATTAKSPGQVAIRGQYAATGGGKKLVAIFGFGN